MYFQKFPQTYYSLDDRASVQTITNLLLRIVFSEEVKNSLSAYDEYDVMDGETPEIVAYKVYGDSTLHWIIMHLNEVYDPRYGWVLESDNFKNFVQSKYGDVNGIHHYEDTNGNTITGNLSLTSSVLTNYGTGNVIFNMTGFGQGYVTSKPSDTNIIITATKGGFKTGDIISNSIMGYYKTSITETSAITGTAVTNFIYEERLNEDKRRIRILKPQYVQSVIKEFESKISQVNV